MHFFLSSFWYKAFFAHQGDVQELIDWQKLGQDTSHSNGTYVLSYYVRPERTLELGVKWRAHLHNGVVYVETRIQTFRLRAMFPATELPWHIFYCSGCGADLSGPTGTFLSPNYPSTYNRNAECYWVITVSQGSSVVLNIFDLDVESHSQCRYDYVQVGLATFSALWCFVLWLHWCEWTSSPP